MTVIAITNEKGGVGKTTTSVTLASTITEDGRSVLLIDLDIQANATVHCGAEIDPRHMVAALITGETVHTTPTPYGFDIVSGGRDLANVEGAISDPLGVMNMRDALEALPHDIVLIDCPPTLGFLTTSAMIASDHLLVPVQTQAAAILGLTQLHTTIRQVQRVNASLSIIGVLPTQYDQRRNLDQQTLEALRDLYPDLLLPSISNDVKLAEAIDHRQPPTHYAPDSRGVREYRAATTALLERL